MLSINRKNIFIILAFTLMALNGCSKSNSTASQPDSITIKIFHNQEWDKWQKERQGFESGTKYVSAEYFKKKGIPLSTSINPQCQELIAEFNKSDLEKLKMQQNGAINLKEVDNSKYQDFIHVADITIENRGSTNKNLETAWILTSLTDDWFNESIDIIQPFPGCKIPRNSVMGDVFQMPNGDKYVVDYLGFGSYNEILKENVTIISN